VAKIDSPTDVEAHVRNILRDVLNVDGMLRRGSALLGAVPELDSIAVTNIIAALEDRFDFVVEEDEINGATFATLGSLVDFVIRKKLAAAGPAPKAEH